MVFWYDADELRQENKNYYRHEFDRGNNDIGSHSYMIFNRAYNITENIGEIV